MKYDVVMVCYEFELHVLVSNNLQDIKKKAKAMNKIPSMVSVASTFSFFKESSPYVYLMINSHDASRRIYNIIYNPWWFLLETWMRMRYGRKTSTVKSY